MYSKTSAADFLLQPREGAAAAAAAAAAVAAVTDNEVFRLLGGLRGRIVFRPHARHVPIRGHLATPTHPSWGHLEGLLYLNLFSTTLLAKFWMVFGVHFRVQDEFKSQLFRVPFFTIVRNRF